MKIFFLSAVAKLKATNQATNLAEKDLQMKKETHVLDIKIKQEVLKKMKLEQDWLTEQIEKSKLERKKLELECNLLEENR